jgi:hypothetical protein
MWKGDGRGVRRRLFNFLSAASLLLCIGASVLWVRSGLVGEYRWAATDRVADDGQLHHRFYRVTSGNGALDIYYVWGATGDSRFLTLFPAGQTGGRSALTDAERQNVGRQTGGRLRLGLRFSPQDNIGILTLPTGNIVWSGRSWNLVVPYWLLVALTGLPPWRWLTLWRRSRKRHERGRCHACGYDLRATPERCPECGATKTS